jgi:hypothetical protein
VPEPHPQMTAMLEMTLEELWLLGELITAQLGGGVGAERARLVHLVANHETYFFRRSFETTRLGPVLAYRRVGR